MRKIFGMIAGLVLLSVPALAQQAAAPTRPPLTGPMAPFVDASAFIGGIKLHVTDMDKAIKYYETVFGMKRFNSNYGANDTLQVMMGFPDLPPPGNQPPGTMAEPIIVLMLDPSFKHVNTIMADFFIRVVDVAAARKRAQDAGFPQPATGATFTDPSGNMMEVTAFHYFRPNK